MKWRDIDWEFGIAIAVYAITGIMLGLALAGAALWGVRQLSGKSQRKRSSRPITKAPVEVRSVAIC